MGPGVLWYHRTLRPGCHHVTMSQCHRALGHEVEGTCWGRKREKEGVLVFPCRMLCQNVYQVIQVQANEVLTKRIRSIKCNLMRQDGGVSGGVQEMNLSFVSRLTCTWDQIRWKQCQTMVAPCLGSQKSDCFLIFLKPDCPETTFSYSHKNPELHPFPEPKRPKYILLPSSSESRCIFWSPTPQLDASESPIFHYQLSNSDEKTFNAAEKNAIEVLLFHILENSSPLYSSLFSSELPHPPE